MKERWLEAQAALIFSAVALLIAPSEQVTIDASVARRLWLEQSTKAPVLQS